ncbi:MAG: signal peptidase II [Candidatus Omnitrophica bacterium]|nr:signal peptidase II [Candidatus Omnitrophota bacterium]
MSALLVAADQLTKFLVVTAFLPGQRVVVGHPFFHLTYVQNTGAAFGLLKGQQTLFILMSVFVMGYLVREFLIRPVMTARVFWGCALILGGATGNVIDRLRLGYVIDFIGVGLWPLFNVADAAITIGIGLLLWHSLRRKHS